MSGEPQACTTARRRVVPERLERRQRRMQAEEAVEVDGRRRRRRAAGRGDGDAAARGVVVGVAVRHDHAEPVHGAALEDRDQDLRPRRAAPWAWAARTRKRGMPAAQRRRAPSAPAFMNDRRVQQSMRYLLWNSGEPRTSAASFSTSVFAGPRSSAVARVTPGCRAARRAPRGSRRDACREGPTRRSASSTARAARGPPCRRRAPGPRATPGRRLGQASAKFMRASSAPVLTQASATSG